MFLFGQLNTQLPEKVLAFREKIRSFIGCLVFFAIHEYSLNK